MRVSKCFSKIFLFLILSVSVIDNVSLIINHYNSDYLVVKEDYSKPTYSKVRV